MGHACIIAKGSFGDVIPIYALARALQARGHQVTLATQTQHLCAARSLGLTAQALDQDLSATPNRAKPPARALSWISNEAFGGSARALQAELQVLGPLVARADVVIGNQLALCGPLVAAQHDRPWIYCAVSPLGLASSDNPCLFPILHKLQRIAPAQPWVNALSLAAVRGSSHFLSAPLRQVQARLGLTHLGHPRFEGLYSRALNLLLTSPQFFHHTPAVPPNTVVTGLTWQEADFLGQAEQLQRALEFIRAGSPPILYALGGHARAHPGDYFQESIRASRALGLRTLIIASSRLHAQLPSATDVHVTSYLPYSKLFPHVQAVVHSGGIGTIGWALRHARPSLLVPQADDQFDNSHRVQSCGWARVLPRARYKAPHLSQALQATLADTAMLARLKALPPLLAVEQGASLACDHLACFLSQN
ncbi:glycosyltransferase [Rhabdochromatium marinum]|uniref:glycosyltransferase n=1 Tax=Rhabdochromatium marinum TaxID=48729 RepID=UPI0019071860|nr:glycosyltransferase [Rhabdochromatium marinum]MBK1649521.1 hypothetical protein [Rhabdochromatium marinum]